MVTQKRMSALTALVLGVTGVATVGIASGSALVAYTMHVAGGNVEALVGFTGSTIKGLPELLQALPPAVSDMLNDRRVPSYASHLDVNVKLVTNRKGDRYRPVLTVTNGGSEVVSMLAVRVAAIGGDGVPVGEWTEVVATPIALEDHDWRGPLMPGTPRYVMVGGWRGLNAMPLSSLTPAVEISEVRVWLGNERASITERVAATVNE